MERPYEPPKITDLTPPQILTSSDTAKPVDKLGPLVDPKPGDTFTRRREVVIAQTLQQIFSTSEAVEQINTLRPDQDIDPRAS